MSSVSCPECQQQISDAAEECPDCGYPIKEQAAINQSNLQTELQSNNEQNDNLEKLGVFGKGVLLAVFCLFIYMMSSGACSKHEANQYVVPSENLVTQSQNINQERDARCENMSERYFSENYKSSSDTLQYHLNLKYKGHYSDKAGACLIEVSGRATPQANQNASAYTTKVLSYVETGKDIAKLIAYDHKTHPEKCFVGNDTCNSVAEWNQMISVFMDGQVAADPISTDHNKSNRAIKPNQIVDNQLNIADNDKPLTTSGQVKTLKAWIPTIQTNDYDDIKYTVSPLMNVKLLPQLKTEFSKGSITTGVIVYKYLASGNNAGYYIHIIGPGGEGFKDCLSRNDNFNLGDVVINSYGARCTDFDSYLVPVDTHIFEEREGKFKQQLYESRLK